MTQHTDGPWHISQDMRGTTRVFAGNSEIVRALSKHGLRRLPEAERDANRRLIAASPELLHALKRCEAMVSTDAGPPNWDWIREVIAKAS